MNDDLPAELPPSRLAGFSHITLTTPNLNRLVRFYETVFGATAEARPSSPPWKAVLQLASGTTIRIFEVPPGSGRQPDDLPLDAGSINHFGLAARDADAFLEIRALLIAGNYADEIVYEGPQGYSIYAVDPDGLFIEVTLARTAGWAPPFPTTAFAASPASPDEATTD